ncbi:MAG: peptide-methionine (S)-S-oxide reductase MsrA [Taibaiella sp.]|nr:peptide-methionine (S)-S-oxide reductase MsrA [Taibaiella sp.]
MKRVFSILAVAIVGLLISFPNMASGQKRNDGQKQHGSNYRYATFAAGCFWCEEYVFESVKGVISALPGYAGGKKKNPTYEEVSDGNTGHSESVNVYYDTTLVSYPTLLKVFFASQDPTQVNGQGPDEGTQYRSIVFYRNAAEKQLTEQYIQQLNNSHKYKRSIAAQVVPYTIFWPAEKYHIQYVKHHPQDRYVLQESIPRVKRFQKQFPELIKPEMNLEK